MNTRTFAARYIALFASIAAIGMAILLAVQDPQAALHLGDGLQWSIIKP